MQDLLVNPGDVVVTDFGLYQHWSFVANVYFHIFIESLAYNGI